MRKLSDLKDLLDADCPLQWAWENLALIGQGHHACIFEHPLDPAIVIRISDYPDGWFEYVTVAEPGPHVPEYLDLSVANGCFLAIARRLEPVPDTAHGQELIECAIAIIRRMHASCLSDEAMRHFKESQPEFEEFIDRLPFRPTDLREDNFMMKDGVLILNDPLGSMSFEMERSLKAARAYFPIETACPAF